MEFKITNNSTTETLWNSSSRITSPSIVCSKNGSTYYIPLFEGSYGSQITYGDYTYTLGRFKAGSKRAPVSRALSNHNPYVTVNSYPRGISNNKIGETNSLKFTVYDADNDNLTVTISCLQNSPSPGNAHNFSLIPIQTYNNISSGSTLSYSGTVLESNAGGYSGLGDYALQISVKDSKGGSGLSSYINIAKNADMFEGNVYWVDFKTRYLGSYTDNGSTIIINNKTGSGNPFQQFCGFDPSLEGKTLTWDVKRNGSSIKSQWTARCANIVNNPTITNNIEGDNIDGSRPTNKYGVKICEGWVPNGEYDLIFTINIDANTIYKYYLHIIMNVSNNPGGSL